MSLPTKIRFDKQEIENIRLPIGQLKSKDIEAIDEINDIDPKDEIAKEMLEVLSKNMSKQFLTTYKRVS